MGSDPETFRRLEGRKYKYPQTKREWDKFMEKALEYQKRRKNAGLTGRPFKRNYKYEHALHSSLDWERDRRAARARHRYWWKKKLGGEIPDGYHVHHEKPPRGELRLSNTKLVPTHDHLAMHGRKRW